VGHLRSEPTKGPYKCSLATRAGHWEGSTLVVDVTTFCPKPDFRGIREKFALGGAVEPRRARSNMRSPKIRGKSSLTRATRKQSLLRALLRRMKLWPSQDAAWTTRGRARVCEATTSKAVGGMIPLPALATPTVNRVVAATNACNARDTPAYPLASPLRNRACRRPAYGSRTGLCCSRGIFAHRGGPARADNVDRCPKDGKTYQNRRP
jgi:hypothetical protein